MICISSIEVKKRIKTWADITMLSLELKRAALRKRHPELNEDEINELVYQMYGITKEERKIVEESIL